MYTSSSWCFHSASIIAIATIVGVLMKAVLLVRISVFTGTALPYFSVFLTFLIERFQRARLDYNTIYSTDPYRMRPVMTGRN